MSIKNLVIGSNTFFIINGLDYSSSLKNGENISLTYDEGKQANVSSEYGGRVVINSPEKEGNVVTATVPFIYGTEGYNKIKMLIRSSGADIVFSCEIQTPFYAIKTNVAIGRELSGDVQINNSSDQVDFENLEIKITNPEIEDKEIIQVGV